MRPEDIQEGCGITYLDRSLILSPVYYGVCFDEDSYFKEMERLNVPRGTEGRWLSPGSNATTHIFTNPNGKRMAIVTMDLSDQERPLPEYLGLLIHESVHVYHEIIEAMGETHPSAEFECYSIQWVAQELIKAFLDYREIKNQSVEDEGEPWPIGAPIVIP